MIEPPKESVRITPQCSLGKSALIGMSEKRTDYTLTAYLKKEWLIIQSSRFVQS